MPVGERTVIAPWFRDRPAWAAIVAGALIASGGAVGAASPHQRSLVVVLLALPVALLAVTFGRAGGVVGGLVGIALAATWSLPALGADVGASGWAAAGSLLVLGALLGQAIDALDASDQRACHAEAERARLQLAARRHAEAVEINDLMVQSVAVAKWSLEAGDDRRAMEILDEIGEAGQRLVSSLLREAARAPQRPDLSATAQAPQAAKPSAAVQPSQPWDPAAAQAHGPDLPAGAQASQDPIQPLPC